MKKLSFLLAILALSLSACADNEQLVGTSELPTQAKSFIQKFFNLSDISYVQTEYDGLHREYNVYLKDATEIDFDHKGNLESIDCQRSALPEGIVPKAIANYVTTNFPDRFITEYVVENRHLKVELNGDFELVFNHNGQFIRMDD